MVWAATMGMPLSLKGVGQLLKLEEQKLDEGKALIKYFSVPCAPTKANGGSTRNLPFHNPEKWSLFKVYNKRNVEVEMAIQQRLANFPVSDNVWDEYHIDQEINERGIRLDMDLVQEAIDMDTRSRSELTAAMKDITDLNIPNSVQQMKQWLSDNGLETDTLSPNSIQARLEELQKELIKKANHKQDYDAIAQSLQMQPAAVRMQLSRARRTIREIYRRDYEDE